MIISVREIGECSGVWDTGTVTDTERFIVAGRDLETFVTAWFEHLRAGGGQVRGLLEDDDMEPFFLIANIASRAARPDASDEELLLYSALAVARDYLKDQRITPVIDGWDGMWEFVCECFDHLHEIGEDEAALALAKSVLSDLQVVPEYEAFKRRMAAKKTDAEIAAHEQEMAEIKQRELRAARLLDPSIDFDAIILSMPLIEEG